MQKIKIDKKSALWLALAGFVFIAVVAIIFIFLYPSGAWLTDEGKWADSEYILGRIQYNVLLNDFDLDKPDGTKYRVVVPIIGGVKINDSSSVAPSQANYEKFAEENFNEGVTLVNIKIENESTFAVKVECKFDFKNMFDNKLRNPLLNPVDIFYMILPYGAVVDYDQKTVKIGNDPAVSYKTYIKSKMDANYGSSDYDTMIKSLGKYYDDNTDLKDFNVNLALPTYDTNNNLNTDAIADLNILVWSEYNEQLPFVSNDKYIPTPNKYKNINGEFTLSIITGQESF